MPRVFDATHWTQRQSNRNKSNFRVVRFARFVRLSNLSKSKTRPFCYGPKKMNWSNPLFRLFRRSLKIPTTSAVDIVVENFFFVQTKLMIGRKWRKAPGSSSERVEERTSALDSSRRGGQTCPRGRDPPTTIPRGKTPSRSPDLHFRPLFRNLPWELGCKPSQVFSTFPYRSVEMLPYFSD